MKIFKIFIPCAMLILTGCATIFNWKTEQTIKLRSHQDDVTVTIYNRGKKIDTLKTPTEYNIKSSVGYFKRANYKFEFTKDGYESETCVRCARMTPWYWLNIIIGGAIGMFIVDPLTGAMYGINGEDIDVNLRAIRYP